jgi:hypothetical protein
MTMAVRNFYLWGDLKQKVYRNNLNILENIILEITEGGLSNKVCHRICYVYVK